VQAEEIEKLSDKVRQIKAFERYPAKLKFYCEMEEEDAAQVRSKLEKLLEWSQLPAEKQPKQRIMQLVDEIVAQLDGTIERLRKLVAECEK
jgi:hypothetical protein